MDTSKGFDLSSLIGQLMSNPQAAQSILKLIGSIAPREEEPTMTQEQEKEPMPQQNEQSTAAISAGVVHRDSRRQMLCAIKPFMSDHRRDMIEKILHASDLISLVKPNHT